jgi:threonylcarbamoyladenosine tRNA methylthiotransferase MtaB
VVPQEEKSWLLDLPGWLAAEGAPAGVTLDPFAFSTDTLCFHTRAFLKIQDGCDSCCSYCRVPQARGNSVSLDPGTVVDRTAVLESRGHREIVVTGVNVSAYRSRGVDLAGLLGLMLGATRKTRIRISSLEPESVTPVLRRVLSHERICPHFHLPVQSGADDVLGRMRRRYRSDRVREAVRLLRETADDPFLAADLITGFPGETLEEHGATCALVRELGLAALHVFPFSPRPGTEAAGLTPAIAERVRSERAADLGRLSRELGMAYARRWVGRSVEALLEPRTAGRVRGVTGNYLKVEAAGVPPGTDPSRRLARVRITAADRTCSADFEAFCG